MLVYRRAVQECTRYIWRLVGFAGARCAQPKTIRSCYCISVRHRVVVSFSAKITRSGYCLRYAITSTSAISGELQEIR
jgi:hypothetical protein